VTQVAPREVRAAEIKFLGSSVPVSAMLSRHHRHVLKCGPRRLENRPARSMGDDSMNLSNVLQCRCARANETHLSFYMPSASW
jgi:hypothetical protein